MTCSIQFCSNPDSFYVVDNRNYCIDHYVIAVENRRLEIEKGKESLIKTLTEFYTCIQNTPKDKLSKEVYRAFALKQINDVKKYFKLHSDEV